MARIRTVKPEFWKHEDLSELPPEVHMLAAALLNYADDEGYFNANPKLVKAECCPLRDDSMNIPDALQELSNIGYIRLGTGTDGKTYGHIIKFSEHQTISHKKDSKIKPLVSFHEGSSNDPGTLHPEQGREGKGTGNREGSSDPNGSGGQAAATDDDMPEIPPGFRRTVTVDQAASDEKALFDYGKAVLGKNGGGLVTKLRKRWNYDDRAVADVIRQASEKQDPKEWIGAVLRGDQETAIPDHVKYPPEIYEGLR